MSVDKDQCSALDYARTYNRQYCLLIIGAYLREHEKNGTLSNYGTAFGMDSLQVTPPRPIGIVNERKHFAILLVCYSIVSFLFVRQIDGAAVRGSIVHESVPVHPPKPPSEPKPTPRTPRGSTSPRKVKAANSSSDDFDNQQQNGNSGNNRVSADHSQQVVPVPASSTSPVNRAPSRRLNRKRTPDDEDDDNSVNNDISERPHQMQVEQRTVTSAGKKKRAYVTANQHAVLIWHEFCLMVVVLLHLSSIYYR
jgi:hypothetical protein